MAITSAFQADDAGSIPVIPSKKPPDSKCQGVSFLWNFLGSRCLAQVFAVGFWLFLVD